MKLPQRVKIVEVGARDGLQDEKPILPVAVKVGLIDRLSRTGLQTIEATSFVSPEWIPQLADAEEVFRAIDKVAGVSYPCLVPNERGMQRALACGVRDIAVFTAASETFSRRNTNAGIAESIARFEPVAMLAKRHGISVRGYISCVLGCPFEGPVSLDAVARVADELAALGCEEISLGDTIGAGTALEAQRMVERVAERIEIHRLAIHFHDTRGQALANILACMQLGVSVIDASVAGLGGCPYAEVASGNVATEDLVYMLHGLGVETGIDLRGLIETGHYISHALGQRPSSKLGRLPFDRIELGRRPQP